MRTHRQVSAQAAHKNKLTAVNMLEMLHEIRDEARSDAVMQGFASSIGSAISILDELRKAAYAAMLEADAMRPANIPAGSGSSLH